jgi:CRISPR system Cascade subunit CasA
VTDSDESCAANDALSFDLTSRAWIPVLNEDGVQDELSLRDVFTRAGTLRCVVGDLPTQEFALLRLLLALAHDALDGPRDIRHWARLWADKDCFTPVAAYLDDHVARFDLLHPRTPFFQVAELRTGRDEVFSLNRLVADVPNGDPFFSSRMPSVGRLGFAEAARWLVHAHAYDTSGIKTGIDGDDRVKGGKVYPLGVGWAGTLGGVFAEGETLRETLLLNLVAADTPEVRFSDEDRPAWRRERYGPGGSGRQRPSGVRDLYTWQSRRLRLHFDTEGVHGVVLGYGDPLAPHNMHTDEPMTAWRRSPAQEKKRGEPIVYLPREHDPARSAWRGLESLVVGRAEAAQGGEAPKALRPGILEWIARLVTEEHVLARGFLIRARIVGAVYGTQQSVIDEIVDDRLSMSVVLLHQEDRAYARQAIDAVADAEQAVTALGDLATDLARATGGESEGPRATARALGFATLDGPYRTWLRELTEAEDPGAHRTSWQQDTYRHLRRLGDQLLHEAGGAAWEGRVVPTKKGHEWLNSALADKWFRSRLRKALGDPFADTTQPSNLSDSPDGLPDTDPAPGPAPSPKVPA